MEFMGPLTVLAALIMLSALFSAVEMSLVSVSMLRVRAMVKSQKRGARTLQRLKESPERMLITVLICNNLVNIFASALATYVATQYFGYSGVGVAVGLMTILILVFGEILPKTFAAQRSEQIALLVAKPVELLQMVLSPLIVGFEMMSGLTGKAFGKLRRPLVDEDLLKTLVEVGVEEKVFDKEDKEFIEGVLKFDDIKVKDVMTPVSRMYCLDGGLTVDKALPEINKSRFSRFPVYVGGDCERIVGSVHVKDILKAVEKGQDPKISDIAKRSLFTSKEAIIQDLFKEMLKRRQHLAIVRDESGHVEGLVTLENLIEEIVGEISDESEALHHMVIKLDKNVFIAHGDTELARLDEALNARVPREGPYSTVGELISHLVNAPLQTGSKATAGDIVLQVEEMADNKPTKVRITVNETKK